MSDTAPRRYDVLAMFIVTTAVAVVGVPWYAAVHGIAWSTWVAAAALYAVATIGVTAGYHRLWSHSAYRAAWPVRVFLALGGALALQNSIVKWAADHRRHHRYVDTDQDPYSINRGWWFAHMGWMLRDYPSAPNDFSNVPDVSADPVAAWQHRWYVPLALGLNIAVPALLGWMTGHVLEMFLVAGFLRIVVSHQCTFLINSGAHLWGTRPYSTENTARDNALLAVLTFGEGYHNFHHAFPGDWRNGVRWYQWDPTKWFIAGLRVLGLAWNLKTTPDERIAARRTAGGAGTSSVSPAS